VNVFHRVPLPKSVVHKWSGPAQQSWNYKKFWTQYLRKQSNTILICALLQVETQVCLYNYTKWITLYIQIKLVNYNTLLFTTIPLVFVTALLLSKTSAREHMRGWNK
jgi:hypothetical protein